MKAFLLFVSICFIQNCSFAQSEKFIGIWEGDLDVGAQKLRMIFTIKTRNDGVTTVNIQAPQQSPLQIPADTLIFPADNEISLEKKQFKMSFTGRLVNDSTLSGNFVQGVSIPLVLKKVEKATIIQPAKRPQTPRPPFGYKAINISFQNVKAGIQLAGTITIPDTIKGKKYPAVILISGSGAQDRDETIVGHKPFAVIADYLTQKGFAVLRYDDRGTASSGGNHSNATSAHFADDTRAAVAFLKSNEWIDGNRIGLIGHSEGGIIAQMVAAGSSDIAYIVMLAGPGIPCIDLLTEQNVAIMRSGGMDSTTAAAYGPLFKKVTRSIIDAQDSAKAIEKAVKVLKKWDVSNEVKKAFNLEGDTQRLAYAKAMVGQLYTPWFRYFLGYKPGPVLKRLSCDVLALNGSRDIQVLPQSNLAGIKAALQKSRSKRYDVQEIQQLNHLFQTCERCSLDEYATLEESFSPKALQLMSEWLAKYL